MMTPRVRRWLPVAASLLTLAACGDGSGARERECHPAPVPLPEAPADGDVLAWLEAVPHVTWVEEQPTEPGAPRFFLLRFEQPVDHCQPDGPTFGQAATFLFRDFRAPTVLASTGYGIGTEPRQTEPTVLLEANQLLLEHRYFGSSKPDPVDWSTLDIAQAAWDHHRIAVGLRTFLSGPWLSTGASKGGMTSLFHRRFFPTDVEATLAYVAPISFGRSDPRYVEYLEGVGDPECQAALKALQRRALELREPLIELMEVDADSKGASYDLLGVRQAFMLAVMEFQWTFWQYADQRSCPYVPGPQASPWYVFDFMQSVFGDLAWHLGDAGLIHYEAYLYQSATQLGSPASSLDHLLDLLGVWATVDEAGLYPPYGVAKPWDPMAMQDVADWVRTEGEQLMFVYGEWDPWTAGALEVGEGRDARVYVVAEGNHGSKLGDLPPAEQAEAEATLRGWLGLPAGTTGALRLAGDSEEERETMLPRWPGARR